MGLVGSFISVLWVALVSFLPEKNRVKLVNIELQEKKKITTDDKKYKLPFKRGGFNLFFFKLRNIFLIFGIRGICLEHWDLMSLKNFGL